MLTLTSAPNGFISPTGIAFINMIKDEKAKPKKGRKNPNCLQEDARPGEKMQSIDKTKTTLQPIFTGYCALAEVNLFTLLN
ncbi:hypothetical protein HRH25_20655 [Flavisolibacter sp. BT320]|nr:hypothetical protein [Flavisolibacter longurius]